MAKKGVEVMQVFKEVPSEYKVFKRRWLILALFVSYSTNGGLQWLEYNIINGPVSKYYNVTPYAVEWTTECYMVCYILLAVPSLWMLNKLGIRTSLLICNAGVCLSSWIKVASVSPEKFYLLLTGQCLGAIAQVLTFGTSSRVAAVWFGANEIALAGSLALIGDQLGTAIGFFLPTAIVRDSENVESIGNDLLTLNIISAITSTTVFALNVLFLRSAPPVPPSAAQVLQKQIKKKSLLQNLRTLMTTSGFIRMFFSYGINTGCYSAFATVLGQVFDVYFEDSGKHAGIVGLIMVLAGSVASVVIGHFMDKTKKFKETIVFCAFSSSVATAVYTYAVMEGKPHIMYSLAIVHGFFFSSYYILAFQVGIELSYPISEDNTVQLMFLGAQIHSLIFTHMYGISVRRAGPLFANIGLCTLLLFSCILASLVPSKMKRQEAEKVVNKEESLETFLSSS